MGIKYPLLRAIILFAVLLPLHAESQVTFRASAQNGVTNGSITINVPAGTAINDVMIASIAVRPSTVTINTPSGWTLIQTTTQGAGTSSRLASYYRAVTGAEPASYTWTFSGAHTGAVGGILSFSGANTSTPIDVNNGQVTASSTNHTAPGVTTTVANGMLVTVHEFSSSVNWTPPGGMTEAVDVRSQTMNAVGISMEMNYEARPATGGTGNRTATAASNPSTGATHSIALRAPLQYYSRNNGTWSGNMRWSLAGCGRAPAGNAEPGNGDYATICNGHNITLDVSINGTGLLGLTINAGGQLQMSNSNNARTLTVAGDVVNAGTLSMPANRNATSILNVGGDITNTGTFDFATDGDSLTNVVFTGGGNHTITGSGAMRFNDVTVNNNLTVNKSAGAVTQAGTLAVANDLTLQSGTLILGATTTIGGNLVNNGTLTPGAGTVTFNGAAAQAISGASGNTTFNNLTLDNANGLSLIGSHNITVNNTATLTSGRVTTGSNHVYISNGSAIAGAGAANFIVGNLRKSFTTGDQTRVFEVGSVTGDVLYAPAVVRFGNVTGAGNFTVSTTAGDHPDIAASTLDANLSINRYWTLSNDSVTFTANANTGAWFVFNDPQDHDAGTDFNEFYVGHYDGANWTEITPAVRAANGLIFLGAEFTMATFPGDYQIGQRGSPTVTCNTQLISGIQGDYFNNMTLSGSATGTRIDGPIDFNWANGAPGVTGIGADQFSVRWSGILRPAVTGNYQFQTVSDDGVRLWIGNTLVINNWTDHASTTNTSGNIALTAGTLYPIRLEFYENGGQAEIRLRWQPPASSFTAIPAGPEPTPGAGLYYCEPQTFGLEAHYSMDETSWTGAANEVQDISGNARHGATSGGASTSNSLPAKTGSPGTCGYGMFDGADDYVTVSNLSNILTGTASLAFWIKTSQAGNDTGWMAPGVTGVEQSGGADDIFWGWLDASGHIGISVANDFATKSTIPINNNAWRHVVLTRDHVAGQYKIYIGGSLDISGPITGGVIGTPFSSIGRIEDTGGTPEYFNGQLDEVRIYNYVLNDAEVAAVMDATRPCEIVFDHIRLEHASGASLTCNTTTLTITACADAGCSSFYSGGVTGTLTAAGPPPTVNWNGGTGFTIPNGSSSVNKVFQVTTADAPTTLGVMDVLPVPFGTSHRCNFGSPECRFIAADTGFIFDVPNHIADVTQNVTISAVRTDDATQRCVPAFQNTAKSVNFWSDYLDPGTGTQAAAVNGTDIAGTSPGSPNNLAFDANGQSTVTVRYPDVGRMQLNARHIGSGDAAGLIMNGQDTFVTRPDRFVLTIPGNPEAPNAGGDRFVHAGEDFEITVEARNASDAITPNYGRESSPETVTLARSLVAPGGGNNPALTGSFGDFGEDCNGDPAAPGTACGTFSWPEVGIITLEPAVGDGNYLGSGNVTGTASNNIGRFYPDHFTLANGVLSPRIDLGCAGSPFTYMGEDLELGFTLTAHAVGGATTLNYTGGFAKLNLSNANNLNFTAADFEAPTELTGRIATGPVTGSWSNGVADISVRVAIERAATPDGPYRMLRFGAAPADSDSVALDSATLDLDTDNDASFDGRRINPADAELRYGRMFMENAFGSELLPLTVRLYAEYFDNGRFILNTDDHNCTAYDAALMTLNPPDFVNPPTGNGTLSNGRYSTPVRFNTPPGSPGSVDATLSVPDYLKFDWDNNSGTPDTDPTAKVTFGIYGGAEDNQIYIREMY